MGLEGLHIPYGAPNAPPFVERFMRTLREEALDHFIFLSEAQNCRVVTSGTTTARVPRRRFTEFPIRVRN